MQTVYLNFYNNLIKLATNKELYKHFKKQDDFSDRLTFMLIHFAFFLKVYKEKKILKFCKKFTIFVSDNLN